MDNKLLSLLVYFRLKNKERWMLIGLTLVLSVIVVAFLAANFGQKGRLPVSTELQSQQHVDRAEQLYGSGGRCRERTNFVFVKVHKCGSHTTTCILQRFGYERGLTFMLPAQDGPNIGYPRFPKTGDYLPSSNGVFNVIADHIRYKKDIVTSLMPHDTAYFAILRHPLSHLKSVFNWKHLDKILRIKAENPVGRFLDTPWYYRASIQGMVRYTANLMAYDMGLNIAYFKQNRPLPSKLNFPGQHYGKSPRISHIQNGTKAEKYLYLHPKTADILHQYITSIDQDFILVMILEYYDESLVMLKRLMCWGIRDILYDLDVRNNEPYRYKHKDFTEVQKDNHRLWSLADYAFYEHFNSTLWEKISSQGPDFFEELSYFKFINKDVNWYCSMKLEITWTIPSSNWNEAFVLNRTFCEWLALKRWHWDDILKEEHIKKWHRKSFFS
ncbi:galactose-3-O-sulfotransferase 2-like [Branchiostoma floridae]|uniref:Galactose-3-O-sulfotransferase 2-like n=1 Tax=Branchiostoma floridae TaxID=7739 RepID=A0A9J7MAY7_BRAFL|nr:galactose-3-O-sulfotransferase 2-like [Branchiostoma floridae]